MEKETQIVKSFLMGDFYWIYAGSDKGWAKDGSAKRVFEGYICPRGETYHLGSVMDDEGPLKEFKNESELEDWFPVNILHKSFNDFVLDKTGKERMYEVWTRVLDDDTALIMQLHTGDISGVGYSKGYEIRLGIVYKNMIFKIYEFKKDYESQNYEIEALYDMDYIKSIEFEEFIDETKCGVDLYLPEYNAFRTYKLTSDKDTNEILSLLIEDGVLTIYDKLLFNFSERYGDNSSFFSRNALIENNVKKIILKREETLEKFFDIPDTLESIELDYKTRYGKTLERFIDANPNLGKYIKSSDANDRIAEREKYNKELEMSHNEVNIDFDYKGLTGFMASNDYQLREFKEYYKDKKEVKFSIGGKSFKIPIDEFWDAINIEQGKKVKYKSKRRKAIEYFGNRLGCTAWMPDSCKETPTYKYSDEEEYV